MKVSLVEWRELYTLNAKAVKAVRALGTRLHALSRKYEDDPVSNRVLSRIEGSVDAADNALPSIGEFSPQSRWLGGDSDDPRNHALMEPSCVPGIRRRFTEEELAEAQARCLGPVQWVFGSDPDAPKEALTAYHPPANT